MANIFGAGGGGGGGSLLSNFSSGLLDVGRRINRTGIGLSSNARSLNQNFLNSTSTGFNRLFSLNVSQSQTVENLQKQILALKSKFGVDDQRVVLSSSRGRVVDRDA